MNCAGSWGVCVLLRGLLCGGSRFVYFNINFGSLQASSDLGN